MRIVFTALAAVVLAASPAAPPAACASCPQVVQGPPCQEFWRADTVFIGYVTEAVGVDWPSGIAGWSRYMKLTARLTVEESFRGDLGTEVTFEMDSCGYPFKEGERYLVYANRDRAGKLYQRSGHTRTRPLAEAAEDVAYIRGLNQPGGGGRIYGTVVRSVSDYRLRARVDADVMWRPRGSGGVPGVKVFTEGGGRNSEARTDGEGRFEFAGLPAGEYRIYADAPAGHTGTEGVKVKLHDKACAPLGIHFEQKGEVGGRVVWADGRPVNDRDARVAIFSAEGVTEEGLANLEQRPPAMTFLRDGRYEFGRLPAGSYYVVVSVPADGGPNKEYRRAFHPDAGTLTEATAVTLAEGQKKTDADIRLPPQ